MFQKFKALSRIQQPPIILPQIRNLALSSPRLIPTKVHLPQAAPQTQNQLQAPIRTVHLNLAYLTRSLHWNRSLLLSPASCPLFAKETMTHARTHIQPSNCLPAVFLQLGASLLPALLDTLATVMICTSAVEISMAPFIVLDVFRVTLSHSFENNRFDLSYHLLFLFRSYHP